MADGIWVTRSLAKVYLEIIWVAFDQLGIILLDFFFKVGQSVIKFLDVVLDAGETAMKGVVKYAPLAYGLFQLLGRHRYA